MKCNAALPYLIGLLVSSYHPHSLNEGVPRVINSCLDALIQCPSLGCLSVSKLCIHLVMVVAIMFIWKCDSLNTNLFTEVGGHDIVVQAEVRIV